MESRETHDTVRLEALRQAASVGVADIDAGNYRTFDTVHSLRAHLDTLADAATVHQPRPSRRMRREPQVDEHGTRS